MKMRYLKPAMQKNHHLTRSANCQWRDTQGQQQVKSRLGARPLGWVIGLLIVACALTACGAEAAEPDAEPITQIRDPYPTFTPTTVPNAGAAQVLEAQTTPIQAAGQTVPAQITAATTAPPTPVPTVVSATDAPASAPAKAVINTALVNIRTGPSTDFEIMTVVDRGEEYELIGKNGGGDWWQVCCVDDVPGWVAVEFVDTDGAVENVPLADNSASLVDAAATAIPAAADQAQPPQAPTAAGLASPAAVEPAAPADNFAFDLIVTEQFPESKVVRIFLYAYQGNLALEGYTLSVNKDGAEVPVSTTSFGGPPGFTWPVADVRQRFQNLKVEFPGVTPAGVWTVQLSKDGAPVGPPATFALGANEANQELYVRYEQR